MRNKGRLSPEGVSDTERIAILCVFPSLFCCARLLIPLPFERIRFGYGCLAAILVKRQSGGQQIHVTLLGSNGKPENSPWTTWFERELITVGCAE